MKVTSGKIISRVTDNDKDIGSMKKHACNYKDIKQQDMFMEFVS